MIQLMLLIHRINRQFYSNNIYFISLVKILILRGNFVVPAYADMLSAVNLKKGTTFAFLGLIRETKITKKYIQCRHYTAD